MKRFVIAIGLMLLAVIPTNAQQQERFVEIGQEANTGLPIVLDRNSVRQNRFNLITKHGDGFLLSRYAIVDCQKRIGQIIKVELYDAANRLVNADNQPGDRETYGANSSLAQGARVAGICGN